MATTVPTVLRDVVAAEAREELVLLDSRPPGPGTGPAPTTPRW
jgi:hypothetical protein